MQGLGGVAGLLQDAADAGQHVVALLGCSGLECQMLDQLTDNVARDLRRKGSLAAAGLCNGLDDLGLGRAP